MSTLNCEEEVQLAEKLVEIHGWADMVRFARSGGEANSIAIRLARAATGRDAVAIVVIMDGTIGILPLTSKMVKVLMSICFQDLNPQVYQKD